ncbi:MAG: hypothetical protein AAFN59_02610 [Pseudomonadota bacterium]
MLIRALALLVIFVAISVALTMYFGVEVLVALGLILTQLKVLWKSVLGLELPSALVWLKSQAGAFLRIELIKKWFMSSLLPLLVGPILLRRLTRFIARYRVRLGQRYTALLAWYAGLEWYEKVLATLVVLAATVALTVSSLGLWLILFSVKLPLWVVAAFGALWKSTWTSAQKMLFRAVAFLQLGWLWRWISRLLPQRWLRRKKRLDYRVARSIVRQRRTTLRQIETGWRSIGLRWALWREKRRQSRQE